VLLRAIVIVAGAACLGAPAVHAGSSASPAVRFSALAGPILGAAAECRDISDERLDGAADAVLHAIDRLSRDRRDFAAANERLQQGIAAGGGVDCARAAAILGAMMRRLPQRIGGAGPPPGPDGV
jgi:hypothetical protein